MTNKVSFCVAIILFVGILMLGVSLRLSALQDYHASYPNGSDGTLEFQHYADSILRHTLNGEKFRPGLPEQNPVFPLILAGVFSLFSTTAYVQYCTTFAIGILLICSVFAFLSLRTNVWIACAGAFCVAINRAIIENSVSGYAEQCLLLLLVLLLYFSNPQGKHLPPLHVWAVAAIAAAICLTRQEGLFIVASQVVVGAYHNRYQLAQFCGRQFPLILVPCLGLAANFWFTKVNAMQSYSGRIGRWFLVNDYMDTTGSTGIYSMPAWYTRMLANQDIFDITPYEWLLNFHNLPQIAHIIASGIRNIFVVVGEQLSMPVVILGCAGLILGLVRKQITKADLTIKISAGWVIISTSLMACFAHGIGTENTKYYLVIVSFATLPLAYSLQQVHWAIDHIVGSRHRTAFQVALYSILLGSYAHAHLLPLPPTQVVEMASIPGEIECKSAFAALSRNDIPTAGREFAKILDGNRAYAPANLGLAIVRLRQGRANEALALFVNAQRAFPWYAEAYVGSAVCRMLSGDNRGAISDLMKCAEHRPDYVASELLIAQLKARESELDQAVTHYMNYRRGIRNLRQRMIKTVEGIVERKNLRHNPKFEWVFVDLAKLRQSLDTLEGGIMDGDLYNWSHSYLNSDGIYEVAGYDLQLFRIPDDAWLSYNLGHLYLHMDNLEEATVEYNNAFKLSPDAGNPNKAIYESIVLNNAAEISLRENKFTEFESIFDRLPPKSLLAGMFDHNMACLFAQKGMFAKAKESLQRSMEDNPGHEIATENLKILNRAVSGGETILNRLGYRRFSPREIMPLFYWGDLAQDPGQLM